MSFYLWFMQWKFDENIILGNPADSLLIHETDNNDYVVFREWHHIDILCVSRKEKVVLCLENKIDSSEHNDQLRRYYEDIEGIYPSQKYRKIYVYLSPDGRKASNPRHWHAMGYQDVLNIIEKARETIALLPEQQLLIENYIVWIFL